MKKIRIAQIGISHEHSLGKIQTLLKMPEVFEIAGVVDDSASIHTPQFGDYWDCEEWKNLPHLTMEQVLNDRSIEAVTVEVPNNECVPVAIQCMERGIPMHMDKPAGPDNELYRKLLKGCEAKHIPFQIGYMFRGNPAINFVLEAVGKGWLGHVYGVQASMIHDYGEEKYQKYLSGFTGGIMYNLGCHFIDFFIKLLGCPDRITSFVKESAGALPKCGNLALAVLEYPHALATVRACGREPNGNNYRRVRIDGDMGMIEWMPVERFDGKPLEVLMNLRAGNKCFTAGEHILKFGPVQDRYEAQLLELAKTIRGEAVDSYTRQHDFDVHRAVLAASGILEWNKGTL